MTTEGDLPLIELDELAPLVMRFFASLAQPWPDPPPPEEVVTTRKTFRDDPKAALVTRTWRDGARAICVTTTNWQELDSNGYSSESDALAVVSGFARDVTLELRGERDFTRWRISGDSADAAFLASKWLAFCERVFREGVRCYEHPAIPHAWNELAPDLLTLAEGRATWGDLAFPLLVMASSYERSGTRWSVAGRKKLLGCELLMLGPMPSGEARACVISGDARDGAVSPPRWDATAIATKVLHIAEPLTLAIDETRALADGDRYGFVDVQHAARAPASEDVVGRERCRIWTSGSWTIRHAEMTSNIFADSFELAIQSTASGVAIFASGRCAGRPHGHWMALQAPDLRAQVVGGGGAELEPIARALEALFEQAGFTPETHWEPPPEPTLPSPAEARIAPLTLAMTEDERARVTALGKRFADALRAGGKYSYRYREEWDACEWSDGAFVWTYGWQGQSGGDRSAIRSDDDLVAKLLGDLYSSPRSVSSVAEAIERLEDAVRWTMPKKGEKIESLPGPRIKPHAIGGIAPMRFASGKVKQGVLEEPIYLPPIDCSCEIAFYESGKLRATRLYETVALQGIPSCTDVASFYESGKLRAVKLGEDFETRGVRFSARHYVDLDEEGRVVAGLTTERKFVRIGADGHVTVVDLPKVDKKAWETARGSWKSYLWITETGVLCGGGSSSMNEMANDATFRELLEGAFHEELRKDFGARGLAEIRANVLQLYRAISDAPLDFEVEELQT